MSAKKSILVGIDYSDHSKNALKEAARMANSRDLPLVCFHILDRDIMRELKHMDSFTEEGVLNFANEKLSDFIREIIGTGHDIHLAVLIGHPFEETLKLIESHQPETLVLGSRGYSTGEHHNVGALASRCIRKATVEVLLVRNFQDSVFRNIVACVDFSETSTKAAYRAAELARQDNATLRLVHVYRPPVYADSEIGWLGPAFPMVQEPEIQDNCESKLANLGYEIGKEFDLQDISTDVIRALSIHRGIYDVLKELEADLVVLGTRGRTGFKTLLLGTTAEGLINTTPCSTLAVKPEGFHYSLH